MSKVKVTISPGALLLYIQPLADLAIRGGANGSRGPFPLGKRNCSTGLTSANHLILLQTYSYKTLQKNVAGREPICFYPRDVVSGVLATATCLAGWVAGWVSVTRRYCIKTAKPILKLFRPSESPSF